MGSVGEGVGEHRGYEYTCISNTRCQEKKHLFPCFVQLFCKGSNLEHDFEKTEESEIVKKSHVTSERLKKLV